MSILPWNNDSPLNLHGHYFTQKWFSTLYTEGFRTDWKYIHSLISGANCFILQIPMLSLGLFTRDVYIIARGEAEGNNVNVEGKESQV